MLLKDFQDFIDLIDPDEYGTIMFSARQSMQAAGRNGTGAYAFFIAVELVKRYHNWLSQD